MTQKNPTLNGDESVGGIRKQSPQTEDIDPEEVNVDLANCALTLSRPLYIAYKCI